MLARLFLCALLIGAFGAANAQEKPAANQAQPTARQPTPQQRAAIQQRNQQLVAYANQILAMIDNGQDAQAWDGMSDVGKKAVTRDKFASTVKQQRSTLGAVKSRKVAAVDSTEQNGKGRLPAGTYVNVRYVTQFAGNAQPESELVSFHLDGDHKWRMSGYAIQQMKPRAGTAPAASK